MSNLKAAILAAQKPKSQAIAVPEWGGVTVELRSMRGAMRSRFYEAVAAVPPSAEGEDRAMAIGRAMLPLLPEIVLDATYDPATGERVFAAADLEVVRDMDPRVTGELARIIIGLSGLGAEAVDEAGKPSSDTPSDASTSS